MRWEGKGQDRTEALAEPYPGIKQAEEMGEALAFLLRRSLEVLSERKYHACVQGQREGGSVSAWWRQGLRWLT